MRDDRVGGAVVLVLVLLLALTGLAHGVLRMSRSELRTVVQVRHAWKATVAAKGALVIGVRALDTLLFGGSRPESGALAAGATPEGMVFDARFQWLTQEYFLLVGVGGSSGWPGHRRVGWLGWSLDPAVRLESFLGGVEVGGGVSEEVPGSISNSPAGAGPLDWPPDACHTYRALLDTLLPGLGLPLWARLPDREIEAEGEDSMPSLGLLKSAELLARAAGGQGERAAPSLPWDEQCPAGSDPVFRGTDGSLTLDEGHHCGVVVVAGDLNIRNRARLDGLVLVGGDLTLDGAGRFEGMGRIGGHLRLKDESAVVVSPCAALWVMEHTPSLRRPILLPEGYRITTF